MRLSVWGKPPGAFGGLYRYAGHAGGKTQENRPNNVRGAKTRSGCTSAFIDESVQDGFGLWTKHDFTLDGADEASTGSVRWRAPHIRSGNSNRA